MTFWSSPIGYLTQLFLCVGFIYCLHACILYITTREPMQSVPLIYTDDLPATSDAQSLGPIRRPSRRSQRVLKMQQGNTTAMASATSAATTSAATTSAATTSAATTSAATTNQINPLIVTTADSSNNYT